MQPEQLAEQKPLTEIKKGEADLKVVITPEKNLRLEIGYDGKGANAGAFVELEPEYFAEKLKAAIPGQVDDLVIDGLIKLLKK